MVITKIRLISALLVPLLLFAAVLGGCTDDTAQGDTTTVVETETGTATESAGVLRLPYSKSDPLHPFKAESLINIQLAQLLYDSLFRVDKQFKPVALIAKDYRYDGLKVTVQLKEGLRFSDSAPLNAEDVVYSFTQATGSPAFEAKLANVASAVKTNTHTVVFTLRAADPDAVNCLDFAIIRKDSRADQPTGSGRYVMETGDGGPLLRANTERLGGFSPILRTIRLFSVSDSESLGYTLQIGNIGFAFLDLADGVYQRINASAADVALPNLLYLAFNSRTDNLKDAAVRRAIHLLTNRKAIAQTAFQGHATVTYTPFHPIKTAGYATEYSVDVPQATELLELAGFSKINDDGIRYSGWVNTLTLTLAVNADNPFKTAAAEQIASDLLKAGIKVNIRALKSAEFLNAVADGTHDMYLVEIRLAPNMTLSPLLSSSGAAAQGMVTAPKVTAAYSEYLEGKTDLTQFVSAFYEDTPFVPLCYRTGIIAYTRSLKVAQPGSSEDVFAGIETWSF